MVTTMTSTCTVAGCSRESDRMGECSMHYQRRRRTGETGPAGRLIGERGLGSTRDDGYRVVKAPGHPLATAQGKVFEHRMVLFDQIGPGTHPCHWCGARLTWRGPAATRINVDHLDDDRANNAPGNLVPSCLDCNTKRGGGR